MATKIYTKQFKQLLPVLFKAKSYFLNSFGGTLEVLDGISNKDKAFSVKVSDMDVVVNDYDSTKDINEGRLGAMNEVTSTDVDVDYEATKAINEAIDIGNVNDDLDQTVAERQEKQGAKIMRLIDLSLGAKISASAAKTLTLSTIDKDAVTKMFNDASAEFTNNEVDPDIAKRAYVTSEIYNFLVDSELAKTDKNAQVNIGDNTLYKFKGFFLVETPDGRFATGDIAYFAADGIGKPFTGFNEYRVLTEVPEFFGVAMQSLVKYGSYVPDANKKAIVKAKKA
ncbi:capsid protein [Enterococcus faecium]|uniref:capsid protein n=1 Tax=Enterococcus faecium TaxID=1352 RepID=UPI000CF20F4B|nr:capsid protein [Enterococcus faecium]PQE64721.1 capsid protein [Enterococcus faecium]